MVQEVMVKEEEEEVVVVVEGGEGREERCVKEFVLALFLTAGWLY